jgi:hypothetical protein
MLILFCRRAVAKRGPYTQDPTSQALSEHEVHEGTLHPGHDSVIEVV